MQDGALQAMGLLFAARPALMQSPEVTALMRDALQPSSPAAFKTRLLMSLTDLLRARVDCHVPATCSGSLRCMRNTSSADCYVLRRACHCLDMSPFAPSCSQHIYCDVPSKGTMVELLLWCWSCSLGSWQVEEARLKERQAAAAAAAEDPAASLGVASRKASGGSDAAPAIATENGEGDGLNISSSVVQVDHLKRHAMQRTYVRGVCVAYGTCKQTRLPHVPWDIRTPPRCSWTWTA